MTNYLKVPVEAFLIFEGINKFGVPYKMLKLKSEYAFNKTFIADAELVGVGKTKETPRLSDFDYKFTNEEIDPKNLDQIKLD